MGAHGVRGQIRLRSFTAEPDDVFTYTPVTDEAGKRIFALKAQGVMKDYFVASLKGITDRDEAEGLKNTKMFVDRAALPPINNKRAFYEADLIGLEVRAEQIAGKVLGVHNYGAGSFIEIQPVSGKSFMLPFTDKHVPTLDVEAGYIEVVIPEGWLAEEKPKATKKGAKE